MTRLSEFLGNFGFASRTRKALQVETLLCRPEAP
jgi:hypothetical protein